MKILLQDWAAKKYSPAPSAWVLRRWVRQGEISPAPELVGRNYYVEERAIRVTVANVRQQMEAARDGAQISAAESESDHLWLGRNWISLVVTREQAAKGARAFYEPCGVGCGVYLVLEPDLRRCAYVGSSVQLSNRLRNSDHIPPGAPTFSFEVPPFWVRSVEATYYDALRPRMNSKMPPGNVLKELLQPIRDGWPC